MCNFDIVGEIKQEKSYYRHELRAIVAFRNTVSGFDFDTINIIPHNIYIYIFIYIYIYVRIYFQIPENKPNKLNKYMYIQCVL